MHRLDQPEKRTIKQIVEFTEAGELAIPNFQRYFRWTTKDIQDLFESIFRGYYVGSFLFWKANSNHDLDLIPVSGTKTKKKDLDPRYIILDGQQRISSLYYVIRAPDEPLFHTKYPYVFFVNLRMLLNEGDSEGNLIESFREKTARRRGYFDHNTLFKKWWFPLFDLGNFFIWLDDFEKYLEDEEGLSRGDARKIKARLRDMLNYVWDKYEIPVIHLPESMKLDHVAEIFERLNSKGIPLTVFDLLNARLLKHGIKLRETWENSTEDYDRLKGFSDENERLPVYILQTMSLLRKNACKRKDLLEINPKGFSADWQDACEYIDKALELLFNLRAGFGVLSTKWIPYNSMIPVIAALLREMEDQSNRPLCAEKLSFWYWSSVFSNAYEGSIDTQMANDFKEVKLWFSEEDKIPETVKHSRENLSDLGLTKIDRASNAVYKGVMCLIALRGAKDFLRGDPLELNSLDDHHMFPKSKAGVYGTNSEINSIVNKTLIEENTNRKYVKDKTPPRYLKKIIEDQKIGRSTLTERLQTHFIAPKAVEHMLKDDFQGFLKEREKKLMVEITKRLGM